MLYFYGLRLGLQSLVRGQLTKETIKNIIVPVNYWRLVEFKYALQEQEPNDSDRILDIGSPKLLSLYLADRVGAEVFATDIEDYFIRPYSEFRAIKQISEQKYHLTTADGRRLAFQDSFFSKVYSISVLEHIPADGDSICMKEIARVLAKDGKCVVTVPFSQTSKEEYRNAKEFYWSKASQKHFGTGKVFFQRRYNEEDLFERIINPSGLTLLNVYYVGERIFVRKPWELSEFLKPFTGPIHPLLSYLFHTRPSRSWRNLKKPLAAIVVLSK